MAAQHKFVFVHFVRPFLLPNWKTAGIEVDPGWVSVLSAPPGFEPDEDAMSPKGTKADWWHIATAKRLSLPLVSTEGLGPSGYKQKPSDIAKNARDEGVQVLFPKDVYPRKIDVAAEIEAFLSRYREQAPAFLKEHPGREEPLQRVFETLQHVLTGATVGRATPAQVTL